MEELSEQLDGIAASEEHNEWRIFGPPGVGKTAACAQQVTKAVQKYGPQNVLVTSFTRAAAAELRGRDLPLEDQNQIGTLHAHCYRALQKPPLAEDRKNIVDWNQQFPYWRVVDGTEADLDDPADERPNGAAGGDVLLADANRWRNRLVPFERWPNIETQQFYKKWREWKDSGGLFDFTDLLETALRDIHQAPGNPAVIFADEAQDFSRLQLAIVRGWGRFTDYFITVGDPDQCIYDFAGATPEAFARPDVPQDRKIVLSQSHRVPRAVHSLAMRWIRQVSTREPIDYRPTSEPGEIQSALGTFCSFKQPDDIVTAAEKEIAAGRSVMFLTSCDYMLVHIRRTLVQRGIPFHNPYRLKRGDWNPLSITRDISAAARILSFVKPHYSLGDEAQPWTAADYKKWADWMVPETFRRGGRTGSKDMHPEAQVTLDQFREWLEPEAYAGLISNIMCGPLPEYLKWWLARVSDSHKKTAGYRSGLFSSAA
jgi:superfamily I DNA/RNA helicase